MDEKKQPIQPQLRRYLYRKAAQSGIPISGTFELTPRCNMDCRMCYIRMSQEEMQSRGRERTADEWVELAQVCRENGMLFLLLTGGEPFLRPDFEEIYTRLSRLGLVVSLNTNGTMITPREIAWLREAPPSRVNITLYGAGSDTYRRLCRNAEGFERATKAIDLLSQAGIAVNLNASFTPYNVGDMEAIYAFAKQRGLTVTSTSYMFPPVRSAKEGRTDPADRFTAQQAGTALFHAKRCLMGEDFQSFLERMRRGIAPEDTEECTRTPEEHMGCMAGRSSFWVTWDGRMTPCGMMNEPVAHPFKDGFVPSWAFIRQETDKILLPAACKDCKKRFACMVCGALTTAEGHGDSTQKPGYLCEMTQTYLNLCQFEERI